MPHELKFPPGFCMVPPEIEGVHEISDYEKKVIYEIRMKKIVFIKV